MVAYAPGALLSSCGFLFLRVRSLLGLLGFSLDIRYHLIIHVLLVFELSK